MNVFGYSNSIRRYPFGFKYASIAAAALCKLLLFNSPASAQVRMVETGATFTEYIALQAPSSVATNFTWTMPGADGSANQCLATNGSGTLFWYTPASGSANSLNASDGSPTNAVYVDAAGNVGIGTTSPGRLLHVTAPMRLTPTAAPGSPAAGDLYVDSGDLNRLKVYDGSNWIAASNDFTTYMYNATPYTPTGGSASPGVAENVMYNTNAATGMAAAFRIGARNATTYQSSYIGAVSNAAGFTPTIVIGQQTATTTYQERLRIDTAGDVGIGTTNPTSLLHLLRTGGTTGTNVASFDTNDTWQTSVTFNNSSSARQYSLSTSGSGNTTIGSGSFALYDDTAAAHRLVVRSTGLVGIGTTNPQAGLDVATTGTAGSAVLVPRDTTANRPSTAVNGMIRYNTTTAKFEGYENGGWVPLSSGLVGSLKYAGTSGCEWVNPTIGTWANHPADTGCPAPTVTGGVTAPGTKIPGMVAANLPAGDYEVTVNTQFRFSASAGNNCRWRISDGTNSSGLLQSSSDSVDISSTVGLFSYASAATRTFQIQAIGTANTICHIYADEPGTVEFLMWIKRI